MPEPRQAGAGTQRKGGPKGDRSKRPPPYYLTFLSVVQGSRPGFRELLLWLRSEVERHGWKQVTACYALTDRPREFFEVYRIPEGGSLIPSLEALGRTANYRALLALCQSRRMELTHGLPYDPGAGGSSGPSVDYPRKFVLQAILTLKPDHQSQFLEAMGHVEKAFHQKEWGLISASQTLTPPYQVINVWRFGDGDEPVELMRDLTQVPQYAILDACCEGQWQRMLRELEMP